MRTDTKILVSIFAYGAFAFLWVGGMAYIAIHFIAKFW